MQRAVADFPEVMTADEVAELLRVSVAHIHAIAKKRLIPARKVGHLWRFDREQLREWMRSGVSSSPEEQKQ